MKTITKEYKVYSYNELSKEAKEKVKNWMLEDEVRNDIFYDDCEEYIKELFKKSDLKCQYSLGYCQGDGLNIYGDLHYKDVFSFLENEDIKKSYDITFTEKEKRTLDFYFEYYSKYIKLPYNNHYCYNVIDRIELYFDILYVLENNWIKNINHKVIEKLENAIKIIFNGLCQKLENEGYNYLYNIDDEEVKENCDSNDYTFLEDGTLFY